MVMWKLGYETDDWNIIEKCWDGPRGQEYDYCGRFQTLAEFRAALAKAREGAPTYIFPK
jgi:hypothetical protein